MSDQPTQYEIRKASAAKVTQAAASSIASGPTSAPVSSSAAAPASVAAVTLLAWVMALAVTLPTDNNTASCSLRAVATSLTSLSGFGSGNAATGPWLDREVSTWRVWIAELRGDPSPDCVNDRHLWVPVFGSPAALAVESSSPVTNVSPTDQHPHATDAMTHHHFCLPPPVRI